MRTIFPSSPELPRITKRELEKVGIELRYEDYVRDWMRRGWCELELYLYNQRAFNEYVRARDGDGA
jgi:hypothetical protein